MFLIYNFTLNSLFFTFFLFSFPFFSLRSFSFYFLFISLFVRYYVLRLFVFVICSYTSREPIDVITILFCGEYVLVSFSLFGWALSISPEERESHQTARRHIRLQWQPHRILHYHRTRQRLILLIYLTTPPLHNHHNPTQNQIFRMTRRYNITQKPVIALVQHQLAKSGQFWMGRGYLGRR